VTVTNFLRQRSTRPQVANGGEDNPIPVKESEPTCCRDGAAQVRAELCVALPERRLSEARRSASRFRQMAMLRPRIAILDETDSGLDIDALRIVANAGQTISVGPEMAPLGSPLSAHTEVREARLRPTFRRGRIVVRGVVPACTDNSRPKGYDPVIPAGNCRGGLR